MPLRIAPTAPLFIAKLAVTVKPEVPVPVMLPPPSTVTVAAVALWLAPMSKTAAAPLTVSAGEKRGG